MLMDIWLTIGQFLDDHCGTVLAIGFIFLIVTEIMQYVVNSSLEEELIDLTERVEVLEKINGIVAYECEEEEQNDELKEE